MLIPRADFSRSRRRTRVVCDQRAAITSLTVQMERAAFEWIDGEAAARGASPSALMRAVVAGLRARQLVAVLLGETVQRQQQTGEDPA